MGVKTTREFTVIESITLGADGYSPALNVDVFDKYSYQITFNAGGGSSAGNISVEVSDNNAGFNTLAGTTLAFTAATTSHMIEVLQVAHGYSRIFFDNTSGTGGTAKVIFKGVIYTD